MEPADAPFFRNTVSDLEAFVTAAVTEQVKLQELDQSLSKEALRTPPLQITDAGQLKTTPRSNVRRPINITAPVEHRNGLSALARSFVPGPAAPPPTRAKYNNEVSGVPSHWVPFYGSAFGLFYDPVTDMFVGDGLPRPSIHRPWDCSLPSAPSPLTLFDYMNEPPYAYLDHRHLQPRSFAGLSEDLHLASGETRFFCFCGKNWRMWPHRCPPTWLELPVRPACIAPGGWLPYGWIFIDNEVTDTDYIMDMDVADSLGFAVTQPSTTGRESTGQGGGPEAEAEALEQYHQAKPRQTLHENKVPQHQLKNRERSSPLPSHDG